MLRRSPSRLLRPFAALVAAYALVLQALFGAVLIGQAGSSDPWVICVSHQGGSDQGAPQSPPHEHCVLCTAGVVHAVLDDSSANAPARVSYTIRIFPPAERNVVHISPTNHYQRGPPGLTA